MKNTKTKLNETHKSLIFNTIENIVKENSAQLDQTEALEWIILASHEMTSNKENISVYLQESASHLLVAIGQKYVDEVFGELKKFFTPGKITHLFVINTMAALAEINRLSF